MKHRLPLTKKQKIEIVTLSGYSFGSSDNNADSIVQNFVYLKPLEKGSFDYVLYKIDYIERFKVELKNDKSKLTDEGIACLQKQIAFLENQLLDEVRELGLNVKLDNYKDLKTTYTSLIKVTPPEEKKLTEAEIEQELGNIISFLKEIVKEKVLYNSPGAKLNLEEEEERLNFLKALDKDEKLLLEKARKLGKEIKQQDYN